MVAMFPAARVHAYFHGTVRLVPIDVEQRNAPHRQNLCAEHALVQTNQKTRWRQLIIMSYDMFPCHLINALGHQRQQVQLSHAKIDFGPVFMALSLYFVYKRMHVVWVFEKNKKINDSLSLLSPLVFALHFLIVQSTRSYMSYVATFVLLC